MCNLNEETILLYFGNSSVGYKEIGEFIKFRDVLVAMDNYLNENEYDKYEDRFSLVSGKNNKNVFFEDYDILDYLEVRDEIRLALEE
jgi:hypothetical protein